MSIAIITIKAVDDAVRYLKSAFWQYGTNEAKYNFTRLEFKEVSYQTFNWQSAHFNYI